MPRPRKLRCVQGGPMANIFKPRGIPARELQEVVLPVEGLEALRLTDVEKLDQETAATRMNISRQTFGRVLAEAREVIAEAVVMGKMIRIQGGSYILTGVGSEVVKADLNEDVKIVKILEGGDSHARL